MKTDSLGTLSKIRDLSGPSETRGLPDRVILQFCQSDKRLRHALDLAKTRHGALLDESGALLRLPERSLCETLQEDYLSFYGAEARCPYVPLAASGPWIITTHGAVIHDSGGYGMLGMGHNPGNVDQCLGQPQVMANIMTPSFSQQRFSTALKKEIGHRHGAAPYSRFLCMNSGSESVTVAARICDLFAWKQTEQGTKHAGKNARTLSLEGSFHGRTELAAKASHSTFGIYKSHLASYRQREEMLTAAPNDLHGLEQAFEKANREGYYIDAVFLEPVLGEGTPGLALTPVFYELARSLTLAHDAMLVVDSIQSGLRASGALSIVDYPGFESVSPPDMETFSKALNGGQYPLSVLAMTPRAAGCYVEGVYGNTMTANPRALEVGAAILSAVTDDLRENIRSSGAYFLKRLAELKEAHPHLISAVHGTGLIVCAEMNPTRVQATGQKGLEGKLRRLGVSTVHAGKNGLRFTPHFEITTAEIDMILEVVEQALLA